MASSKRRHDPQRRVIIVDLEDYISAARQNADMDSSNFSIVIHLSTSTDIGNDDGDGYADDGLKDTVTQSYCAGTGTKDEKAVLRPHVHTAGLKTRIMTALMSMLHQQREAFPTQYNQPRQLRKQ